ncbi:MAG: methylenetetrahydrofolate--tRNA-(uracil(54)-C(5))-methyltransferase (FADH(2)-oxidizing) TrmFO [Pseudomonadota bacterium]
MNVVIIGGGLAGSEAACTLARHGCAVDLYEMKPTKLSPAHRRETLGELVCSNSLGAEEWDTAPGLLKYEMSRLGSVVLNAADRSRIPAGRALGVDRDRFSDEVTATVSSLPGIRVIRQEVTTIPEADLVIVASGPLTSDALSVDLAARVGSQLLYFYDSLSPIVTADSIDYGKTYFASRYEPGKEDYLNCPMDRVTYEKFVGEIRNAEKVPIRAFEAMRCFEACLPIEVLAERGEATLAFGPMKPVGLEDPRTGKRPHAVVQLRRENHPTTLYNLVGFQTRMKWGEQQRIFRMIPGLENAEFARMGSMHRNTYLESPRLLGPDLALKSDRRIILTGQIVGVEGYVESSAMGIWAGLVGVARLQGLDLPPLPPPETAIGALLRAVTTIPLHGIFSPMNVNFGLFPPVTDTKGGKEARRRRIVERAHVAEASWRERLETDLGRAAPIRTGSEALVTRAYGNVQP